MPSNPGSPSSSCPSDFRVVIVGGGITGLALGASLERANIKYVLLEARDDVAPQVGASIAILSNGARILDQLGVWDKIRGEAVAHENDTVVTGGKGKVEKARRLNQTTGDNFMLKARHGYEVIFFQRQRLQQELYNAISDQSCVLTNRKVVNVEHGEKEVVVKCANGEEYRGDVLVGADGTHSFVREKMRGLIDTEDKKKTVKDRKSQNCEYSCLYGISTPVPGIEPASMHRAYNRGLSCLTIGGLDTTYWFLYKRLDKVYRPPHIPRYTQADADAQAAKYMDFVVGGTDGDVTIRDLWERKKVGGLQAMDEGHFENWTWGRVACVGDSAHKVTANAGTGGNLCLEGAAALANSLHKLLYKSHDSTHTGKSKATKQKPGLEAVRAALESYHNGRKDRAREQVKGANDFTRYEDFATLKGELTCKYFMPYSGSLFLDKFSGGFIGATKLDFLPDPKASLGVNMPWNSNYGVTKEDSLFKRVVMAAPLLAVFYFAKLFIREAAGKMGPLIVEGVEKGWILDAGVQVPVREVYTGLKNLDGFAGLFVAAFTPAIAGLDGSTTSLMNAGHGVVNPNAPQRLQTISFFADVVPLAAIWMIESCRRGNIFTFARIPLFFLLLAQLYGIGMIAPVYYFLHFVQIPSTTFHAADNRHVPIHQAKTILPAIFLGFIVPTVAMYWPTSTLSTLQGWNFVWQLFPIWLSLFHGILSRLAPNTEKMDRINNVRGDLLWIRLTYLTTALISACAWIYMYLTSPTPFSELFFSGLSTPFSEVSSLEETMGMLLKFDEAFCFLSAALWVVLCFWDLKREGRVTTGWGKILGGLVAACVVFGPGAGLVGMWGWREDVLARGGLEPEKSEREKVE